MTNELKRDQDVGWENGEGGTACHCHDDFKGISGLLPLTHRKGLSVMVPLQAIHVEVAREYS